MAEHIIQYDGLLGSKDELRPGIDCFLVFFNKLASVTLPPKTRFSNNITKKYVNKIPRAAHVILLINATLDAEMRYFT